MQLVVSFYSTIQWWWMAVCLSHSDGNPECVLLLLLIIMVFQSPCTHSHRTLSLRWINNHVAPNSHFITAPYRNIRLLHTSTELANVHAGCMGNTTPLKSVVAHFVTDDGTILWKTKTHRLRGPGTELRGILLFLAQTCLYYKHTGGQSCMVLENCYQDPWHHLTNSMTFCITRSDDIKASSSTVKECLIMIMALRRQQEQFLRGNLSTSFFRANSSVRSVCVKYITSIINIRSVVSVKTQK